MDEIIKDKLRKLTKTRFYSCKIRCKKQNFDLPSYEDYKEVLLDNYERGFKCDYCGVKLDLDDLYPYKLRPSVDHKIPLSVGGSNNKDNLIVCCTACNIVKGTLKYETYKKLIEILIPYNNFKEQLINEWFTGKYRNKIERVGKEKQKVKRYPLHEYI